MHKSGFNGSELYDSEQFLQSSNLTSGQPISGIYGWSPVLQDKNNTEVSEENEGDSLAWETRSFIEQAWDNLNKTGNRSVIEHAWDSLNETSTQMPRFRIPIRDRRSIVSPQTQIQITPKTKTTPKVKRKIGVIVRSLLGAARSGFVRNFFYIVVQF